MPCGNILITDLQLLLVTQASKDPRTGAELGTGTFSARQARSPGLQSHAEHLTRKHPAPVWWQGRGGRQSWHPPGLPSIETEQQCLPTGAWLGQALLDTPLTPPQPKCLLPPPSLLATGLPHRPPPGWRGGVSGTVSGCLQGQDRALMRPRWEEPIWVWAVALTISPELGVRVRGNEYSLIPYCVSGSILGALPMLCP